MLDRAGRVVLLCGVLDWVDHLGLGWVERGVVLCSVGRVVLCCVVLWLNWVSRGVMWCARLGRSCWVGFG